MRFLEDSLLAPQPDEDRATRAGSTHPRRADAELVEAMARGEESALRTLYERHGRAAFSLACSIVGSREEAEEVLVDAFLHVWNRASTWDRSRGTPCAWLMVITRSRALDRIRSRRRYRAAVRRSAQGEDGGLALPVGNAGPHPEAVVRRHGLSCLLEILPEPQREVIVLAYFGGLTHREIASSLELPLGTVKSRLRLAMDALTRAGAAEMQREGEAAP